MMRNRIVWSVLAVGSLVLFGGCASTPTREQQEMAWFINYLNTAADDTNQ